MKTTPARRIPTGRRRLAEFMMALLGLDVPGPARSRFLIAGGLLLTLALAVVTVVFWFRRAA